MARSQSMMSFLLLRCNHRDQGVTLNYDARIQSKTRRSEWSLARIVSLSEVIYMSNIRSDLNDDAASYLQQSIIDSSYHGLPSVSLKFRSCYTVSPSPNRSQGLCPSCAIHQGTPSHLSFFLPAETLRRGA